MNPLEWKLPDWRHLDELRPDFPDIDIDSESSKREAILNRVKEKYGEKNVINVGTFRQEAPKAAIQKWMNIQNILFTEVLGNLVSLNSVIIHPR